MRKVVILLVLATLSFLLLRLVLLEDAPTYYQKSPEASLHYLDQALAQTGTDNVVAAVLFDYRAFDTVGEALVIVTAAIAISLVFATRIFPVSEEGLSLIVKASIAIYSPLILLMGVYTILFSPGGGFKGGVLLGALAWIYLIAFGSVYRFRLFDMANWQVGMALAALGLLAIAAFPMVWGEPFLTNIRGIASGYVSTSAGSVALLSILTGFAVAMGIGVIFFSMARVQKEG